MVSRMIQRGATPTMTSVKIFKSSIRKSLTSLRKLSDSAKSTKCPPADKSGEASNTTSVVPDVSKNWISYGFESRSLKQDRRNMHSIFFITISVTFVGGIFWLGYIPDFSLSDWAQREAFLELRRREESGLPAIDMNIVDPASISLPTDDELGDQEIIV